MKILIEKIKKNIINILNISLKMNQIIIINFKIY